MKLMRMPLFTWTALCTSILMMFAMPPLTVAMAQLALDRYLGFHYFTNALGGNMMHFVNLFWLFGHPEVYILILPSFGMYSEVISTFSGKVLYGYRSLVMATMAIAILSFTVWLHHFFTMGQSANINAVFGIASMLIGIPTGVKIYDWMWTMFRGRIRFTVPMVYSIGFIFLFVLGGMSGILLADPGIDYQVHNSVFLVAHFHNVAVPGVLFGMIAGYHFWFPKAFGFRLNERWGMISAVCWIFGFMLAFFPLYALGLMGLPRRTVAYTEPSYVPLEMVAFLGALLILAALAATRRAAVGVDQASRREPRVCRRSVGWPQSGMVDIGTAAGLQLRGDSRWSPIAMRSRWPRRTATPISGPIPMPISSCRRTAPWVRCCGAIGFALAFGLVWHIWWMVILVLLAAVATMIVSGFARDTTRIVPAQQVRQEQQRWIDAVAAATAISRADECKPANAGLAVQEYDGVVP